MRFPRFGLGKESKKGILSTINIDDESIRILTDDVAGVDNLKKGFVMGGWSPADNNLVSQIVERAKVEYENRGEDFPENYEDLLRKHISQN